MKKIVIFCECALKELLVKVECGPAGGLQVTDFFLKNKSPN